MTTADQSFDGLSAHFQHKIYNSPKGKIRLRVLSADFEQYLPELARQPTQILDSGCGQGQFALQLAQQGHDMVLNDLSRVMIEQAEANFRQHRLHASYLHGPIQRLPEQLQHPFALILNHAVLEWCEAPYTVLQSLLSLLAPGGTLSLMFYNIHGIRLRNLVRGNLKKVKSNHFKGEAGGLTPINPLDPAEIIHWLEQNSLQILCHSGVRTFYDLMDATPRNKISLEDIVEQELALRHQPPYRDMGRYIHLLCRKP
jgi:S-adenosylmethionine-dependent methyltransferase